MVKRFNVGDASDRITEITPSISKTTAKKVLSKQVTEKKIVPKETEKEKPKKDLLKKGKANDPFDEGYEKF